MNIIKNSDRERVAGVIEKIIAQHHEKQFVIVNNAQLYRACKLERFSRQRFVEEVQDALTNTQLVHKYGTWLYAEWEMNTWIFMRVATAEESKSCADDILTTKIRNGTAFDTTGYFEHRRMGVQDEEEQYASDAELARSK